MKKPVLLRWWITLMVTFRPEECDSALWRPAYYAMSGASPYQIRKRYQPNYATTPRHFISHRENLLNPAHQGNILSPPWVKPSPRTYYQQGYLPWKTTTPRPYYPQAPPPVTRRPQTKMHESRSSCIPKMHSTLELVLKKAMAEENQNRGKHKAEIVKSISNSDIKQCRECEGNVCVSYKNVELAMTIAPACKTKSKFCICGVDRTYPKRMCTVSAKFQDQKGVYDLLIFCERRLPTTEVKAWRRKEKRLYAKRVKKLKARRMKRKKRKRRKKKAKKMKRPSSKLRHNARRGNEILEEPDFSAEGPVLQRPAPIVLWDENTSQATIVLPKKTIGKLDSRKTIH